MRRHYVIAGGTMVHVAPHFALCAPAYGEIGDALLQKAARQMDEARCDFVAANDIGRKVSVLCRPEGPPQTAASREDFARLIAEAVFSATRQP